MSRIKLSEIEYKLALKDGYGSRKYNKIKLGEYNRQGRIIYITKKGKFLVGVNDDNSDLEEILMEEARERVSKELALEFSLFKEGLEEYE